MVAISLYRGNLHKVPNIPRRWLVPTPKISLKDFRLLLDRRSRALARINSTSNPNPIPNPIPIPNVKKEEEDVKDDNKPSLKNDSPPPPPQPDPPKISICLPKEEGPSKIQGAREEEANHRRGSDSGDGSERPLDGGSGASPDAKPEIKLESGTNPVVDANGNSREEKPAEALGKPNEEMSIKVDVLSDKEKRKKEVEEKLQILNARKHNLVQVLKQILTAEEELKRRSSMQGTGIRPSVPLQVDVTNDSGSMTRLTTPRLGSEGNLGADIEGGEADDVSNQNMQSRHSLRRSSTSPSSDSPHRRPALSAVPHPSRASLAVAGSPSRFAPTGHQGHPANLPLVSVSGTSYLTSSPSPAASGGTSAFRDSRLPSPWN